MSTTVQEARIELSLNAQKATDKLNELTKEAAKLNKELQATEKGTKQYEKLEKQLNAVEKNMRKAEKAAFDVNKVLDNLSGASINDINKAIKEMTRQMNGMDRNSEKWKFYKEQIERAKDELKKISSEGKQSESWLSRFNNKFAKWGSLVATAVAGFTGLTLTIQKFRQMAMEKESSQANLKALTGLDDQSIAWLTEQAEQLSTTMEKSGLRVRKTSQEILDAYTLVGSAKPELLSNKEALNAVTIEAMRLAEAAKMDLNQAVDAVTLSMNQYGASADQAARYTNVMAAGSKFGSAAVQSVTTAVQKAGVAASTAGIPIEALVGSIETLAEKGIKDEVAGTGLKTFFLKLEGMAEDVRPSVVGLQTALENLQAKQMDSVEMQKAFGLEAYTVAQAMISGADKVKYYTEAVTGTNVAVEQASINSQTAEARMAQARNRIKEVGIELGQRLTPFIISTTKFTTLLMEAFTALIDACAKYKTTIIAMAATITSLIAVKKAYLLLKNAEIALIGVEIYWNYKLKVSIKNLWTVLKANPYGIVIAAATALVGVLATLATNTTHAERAQQKLNNRLKEFNDLEQQRRQRAEELISVIQDKNETEAAQLRAYEELKKVSPDLTAAYSKEQIAALELADAYKILNEERDKNSLKSKEAEIETLQQRIRKLNEEINMVKEAPMTQANSALLGSLSGQLVQAKEYLKALQAEYLNEIGNAVKAADAQIPVDQRIERTRAELEQALQAAKVAKEALKKEEDKFDPKNTLTYGVNITVMADVEAAEAKVQSLKEELTLLEKEKAQAEQKPEKKKKSAYDLDDDEKRDRIDIIKSRLEAQLALEETAYITSQKTEEEHLAIVKQLNIDAINAMQTYYAKGSKEWEELEAEKTVKTQKYEQDIYKIKKKYEEDRQNFAAKYQEKSLEEKKQNELEIWDELNKEKEKRDELYYQIRNEIIKEYDKLAAEEQEKEKRKQEKEQKEQMAKLKENVGSGVYGLVDKGIIDDSKAKDINSYLDSKGDTEDDGSSGLLHSLLPNLKIYENSKQQLDELFQQGLISQTEYADGLAELQKDNIAGILEDIAKVAEQAWSQISALMNAGSELMQANMDLEIAKINQRYDVQLQRAEGNEKETKKIEERKEAEIARVKNEYNKRQMKMQMAQTLATSAIGILNAWVSAMALPAPASIIMGGILSGIIVAQTAIQIAALKKQQEAQAAGYYSGGYTSRTLRDTDPAGVVHGNEFVVNARAVRNPAIRPMLDFIDTAQRNNYISSITSADVARAAGSVPTTTVINNNNTDTQTMLQVITVVEKLSKKLDKPIVAHTYMMGQGGIKEAEKEYDKIIRNSKL